MMPGKPFFREKKYLQADRHPTSWDFPCISARLERLRFSSIFPSQSLSDVTHDCLPQDAERAVAHPPKKPLQHRCNAADDPRGQVLVGLSRKARLDSDTAHVRGECGCSSKERFQEDWLRFLSPDGGDFFFLQSVAAGSC